MVWLRPEYTLAMVTSLYYCSQLVLSKTYDRFLCATEEGYHQISCPDDKALLTDISVRKVHRRTQMCAPDDHSDYLVHCQSFIDASTCEGNQTCSIEFSSRDYLQCGEKNYAPTYFYIQYTCIQIHTMCTDTAPIRNTLNGYIVSPAYPHPMADNLKCSINIEADPSMFIEVSPIQVQLQDAVKCRSEYLDIFGYDSTPTEKNANTIWKSYQTWCGTDQSSNHPVTRARYLIASNSLYMSLHTSTSKKSRYFKIRYKIVPSIARSQYDSDGVAYGSSNRVAPPADMSVSSSTPVLLSSTILSSMNMTDVRELNGTSTKRTLKKEIIIGIVAGVIVLLLAITAGIVVFIFLRRRRSSGSSNSAKKSTSASTTATNPSSKPTAPKSADKAPLLEPTNTEAKRKLVPERTVQVADAGTSRFKPNEPAGQTGSNADNPPAKPSLSAADSGIYGADLIEEKSGSAKGTSPLSPVEEVPKAPSVDASSVVANPSSTSSPAPAIIGSTTEETSLSTGKVNNDEKEPLLIPFDDTIQSAYPSLIDATTSENEGTICGSTMDSRRTSDAQHSLLGLDSNHIEALMASAQAAMSGPNPVPFNPLHVILKKDATKYYTTEYI